jgi:membrane protein
MRLEGEVSVPNITQASFPAGAISTPRHRRRISAVLREIWAKILRDDLIDLAAEMAYFFVLALFPFFAVLGALAGFLPYTNLWTNVSHEIIQHFPSEARDLALQTFLNLAHKNKTFLSIGFVATVWASSSGLVALMENLSRAYNVPETRGFWTKRLIAIGILVVSSAFFFGAFGLLTLGHRLGVFFSRELYFGPGMRTVWEIFRWSFLLILLQTGIAIIDNVLPNKQRPWRWISPGTVFSTIILVAGTSGVNFYVRHIGHYSETYGAIGAFFVLMVWIFFSSLTLLVGAEINAVLEKRQFSSGGR